MKNPFTALFRARDKPKDAVSAATTFSFGIAGSGKSVNARSAIQVSAVYACVRILSEAIAGLPLHLYRYKDDGGKEKAIDHPLYLLLHDEPNPEMSSFVFRETFFLAFTSKRSSSLAICTPSYGKHKLCIFSLFWI